MTTKMADTVSRLEARRATILRELESITGSLNAVARAIGTAGARAPRRKTRGTATPGTKRAWFERNEAPTLLRELASKPKSPAQLVRELAKRKRYAGRLPMADRRRFEGAAYMAIAHAVATGNLRRQRDGSVIAR